MGSKSKDAAGAIGAAAKAAAKVVCPVIKPMCPGACGAALTAFKTAGTVLAATYHIPLNCLSGALEKGCKGLCTAICGRRLVTVRVHHHHRGLKGKKAKKHHKKAAAKRELKKKHHKKAAAKKAAAKRDLFGLPSMDRLKSCAGTAGCALKVAGGGVMGALAALTGGCLTTVKKCVFGRRMSKTAQAKLGEALKKKVAAHKKAAAAAKRELRRHLRRHLGKKEKVVAAIKKKVAAQ